jgi:hypothetical protein
MWGIAVLHSPRKIGFSTAPRNAPTAYWKIRRRCIALARLFEFTNQTREMCMSDIDFCHREVRDQYDRKLAEGDATRLVLAVELEVGALSS